MKDYLCVIITDGVHEWQQQAIAVPRVGEHITCRRSGTMEKVFGGEVENVHWEVRDGHAGMVVTVWLKPAPINPSGDADPAYRQVMRELKPLRESLKGTPKAAKGGAE